MKVACRSPEGDGIDRQNRLKRPRAAPRMERENSNHVKISAFVDRLDFAELYSFAGELPSPFHPCRGHSLFTVGFARLLHQPVALLPADAK